MTYYFDHFGESEFERLSCEDRGEYNQWLADLEGTVAELTESYTGATGWEFEHHWLTVAATDFGAELYELSRKRWLTQEQAEALREAGVWLMLSGAKLAAALNISEQWPPDKLLWEYVRLQLDRGLDLQAKALYLIRTLVGERFESYVDRAVELSCSVRELLLELKEGE